jgi:hypothetical protein
MADDYATAVAEQLDRQNASVFPPSHEIHARVWAWENPDALPAGPATVGEKASQLMAQTDISSTKQAAKVLAQKFADK